VYILEHQFNILHLNILSSYLGSSSLLQVGFSKNPFADRPSLNPVLEST